MSTEKDEKFTITFDNLNDFYRKMACLMDAIKADDSNTRDFIEKLGGKVEPLNHFSFSVDAGLMPEYLQMDVIKCVKKTNTLECIENLKLKSFGDVSDGYHTFNELYEHRITLFIALCRNVDFMGKHTWKMEPKDGWFLMGISTEAGKQITYHLPESKWEETSFARIMEEKDFIFDGHTSADVLERLKNL